jgi:ankyrin repeat protein
MRWTRSPCTLHEAANMEDGEDMIRFLVSQGANVNETDSKGWTPLHIAIQGYY